MTSQQELVRLWSGGSIFGSPLPQAASERSFPLALVANGASAGAAAAGAAITSAARPVFGVAGLPPLRSPLLLDATFLEGGSTKAWAAIARGVAAAGAALQLTPAQFGQRKDVLRASGVPLAICMSPGDAMTPEACASAALLIVAIADAGGTPAVLHEDALAGLVEAVRGTSLYKAPAAVFAPAGRLPPPAILKKLAEAGAAGLGVGEAAVPSKIPFAGLMGALGTLQSIEGAPALYLACDDATDGARIACALAGGASLVATSVPLRLASAEESAMDADWKAVGDQLAVALRVLWQDAQRAAASVGVGDPRDLARDNLRALTYDAAALSGLRLAGFDERLPWWAH